MPNEAAKFFVYGGLIVDTTILHELHDRIEAIRLKYGYKPGDLLKFDTNVRPSYVPFKASTAAKNDVVQACIDLKCKFIAYVVLHAIAKTRQAAEIVSWGANCVIAKFNYFLQTVGGHGIVAIDRFPAGNDYSFLTDKFCFGLEFPDDEAVTLDRIKLLSSTCINASHASSAMDITLGAFRYCINAPQNVGAAKAMMANISRMIWCTRKGDILYAIERGLVFRPKVIKHADYKAEYDSLLTRINALIADATI